MSKSRVITTEKPWGLEETWADSPYYKGKILTINSGHRLSRKYHRHRTHTITVVSGVLTIEAGPTHQGGDIVKIEVAEGEAYHLPSGQVHRFCAEGTAVRLIEVSQGGASDYVRVEDDYDRISNLPGNIPHSTK